MSHPLTNALSEIEMLEERCRQQAARIEALEAALREIIAYMEADEIPHLGIMADRARAALDKDAGQ